MSVSRPVVYLSFAVMLVLTAVGIGGLMTGISAERRIAQSDAKIAALRGELMGEIDGMRAGDRATGTAGSQLGLEEVKRQIQTEMGLFPVKLLRERRQSFVELNANDNRGRLNYGTAGYLGNGYFITVKHGVIALDDLDRPDPRRIVSIKVKYKDKNIPAEVVDMGNAPVEVHSGDWAIIHVNKPIDLPPLQVNTTFSYDFADPVVRLGNDYSKGIILATGYIGQRTTNGLVTCLTDGHPGVSGGGVLDQRGSLVGIPVGRMEGDYRFSFILPLRAEMFRKVPGVHSETEEALVGQ